MSSTTASGALSILSNYGSNSSMINAIVKSKELTEEQATEIASLRKQLASLTSGTTNSVASGTTNNQTAASAMQQLANYPAGYNAINGGANQLGQMMRGGSFGYPMMNGMVNGAMNGMVGGMMNAQGGQNGVSPISTLLNSGSPVTGSSLQQALQQSAQTLQARLAEICKANNIDTNQDVTLNLDSSGQIIVTGDTSDKDKLQTALRADSTFTQLFSDTKLLNTYVAKMQSNSAS